MTQEDYSLPCNKSVEKNNDRMGEIPVRMEVWMLRAGNSYSWCGEGLNELYKGVLDMSNH
jgi:hypothetical protein